MSAGRTPRLQRLQAGIAASRTGASPAQVYGRYTTGTSSVHDRYMTGSVRPGPLGGTRNPCGRYSTAGSLNTPHPCQRRSPRRRPISRPGGDAHPVTTSVTARQGCRGLIRLQRTRKTSRLLSADRTAEYRPTRDARQYQSRRAAQRPHKGTKRAWIGKASGYTHRLFHPDAVHHMYVHTAMHRPAVTQADTWRDEKETARRAAFPQQAGRFRRWWQVLGSNQRRLSRRFYRPLPLATRATCRVPSARAASKRIAQDTTR